MLRVAYPLAATIVHKDDMHRIRSWSGLAEMRGESGCRLTCACSAEHALEDGQTVVVGDDFLQSDGGDVKLRTTCAHVGIALIGADHDVACLCNTEIATSHTCIGRQKLVAEAQAGYVGQIGGIVVALLAAQFFFEQFAHIVVVQMDGGHHDVAGCLALQLNDALTKVGLYHFDAVRLQVGVHAALLGQHRLRFHHLLHVVVLQNAVDNLVELVGILCPMHDTAVFFGLRGKLVEVFIQMGDGVALDL